MPTDQDAGGAATLEPEHAAAAATAYVDQDTIDRTFPPPNKPLDLDDDAISGLRAAGEGGFDYATDGRFTLDLDQMETILSLDGQMEEGSVLEAIFKKAAMQAIKDPRYDAIHIISEPTGVNVILGLPAPEPRSPLHDLLDAIIGPHLHHLERSTDTFLESMYALGMIGFLQAFMASPNRALSPEDLPRVGLFLTEDQFVESCETLTQTGYLRTEGPVAHLTVKGTIFATVSRYGYRGCTVTTLSTASGISESQIEKHLPGLLGDGTLFDMGDGVVRLRDTNDGPPGAGA